MRFVLGSILVVALVAAIASTRSWSQTAPNQDTSSTAEPITGTPMTPNGTGATAVHDPFTPWPLVGSAGEVWTYDQLNDAEKAVADRGRVENDPVNWDAVNNAYASANAARSQAAAAAAAANTINAGDLANQGVVP